MDSAHYRRLLGEALAGVDAAISEAVQSASTVTLDQSSVGRLSRMDAMHQQAMAQSMRDRLLMQRRKILAALGRIDAGTYGECCQCGAALGAERLERDPAVVFCAGCMAEREHGARDD